MDRKNHRMLPVTRGKSPRPSPPLTLLLWQDALLEWGIPVVLLGAILCFVLLGSFAQIAPTSGVLGLGWSLLLLVGFLLFKPLLSDGGCPGSATHWRPSPDDTPWVWWRLWSWA